MSKEPFDAAECRRRNKNAIRNTHTGRWLGLALKEIKRLESELKQGKRKCQK